MIDFLVLALQIFKSLLIILLSELGAFLNQARAGRRRPACAWFLKVAVKRIFHGNNCFLNIAETKPFTPINSRYSLSILSNR